MLCRLALQASPCYFVAIITVVASFTAVEGVPSVSDIPICCGGGINNTAVRMALFIEYSPAVQEVPGSIPG